MACAVWIQLSGVVFVVSSVDTKCVSVCVDQLNRKKNGDGFISYLHFVCGVADRVIAGRGANVKQCDPIEAAK